LSGLFVVDYADFQGVQVRWPSRHKSLTAPLEQADGSRCRHVEGLDAGGHGDVNAAGSATVCQCGTEMPAAFTA
jgi:hypothetical protein